MIPENYRDLFSNYEPDELLRELDGRIIWYYTPVDSNDPRGRMWSMAPFDAATEIKRVRKENERLRAALQDIAEIDPEQWDVITCIVHARTALKEGE